MLRLIAVMLSACSLIACSSQSPVAPGGLGAPESSADAKPPSGVAGVYALSFVAWVPGAGYQEVSSLPVGTAVAPMNLKAQVTDASGNPATAGTVTFEYCSYGKPTDDITNPDEAPKEACEQGAAKWVQLRRAIRVSISNCSYLGGASACTGFGSVRIPRSVGFRFRYAQQGSNIAGGTSPARDFVWTAQLP